MTQPSYPESEQQPEQQGLKHIRIEQSLLQNHETEQRVERADTLLSVINAFRKISKFYTTPDTLESIRDQSQPSTKLQQDAELVPHMILDINTFASLIRDSVDVPSRIAALEEAAAGAEKNGNTDNAENARKTIKRILRGKHLTTLLNNPTSADIQAAKESGVFDAENGDEFTRLSSINQEDVPFSVSLDELSMEDTFNFIPSSEIWHDINNPLTMLNVRTQMFEKAKEDPQKRQAFLDALPKQLHRLLSEVTDAETEIRQMGTEQDFSPTQTAEALDKGFERFKDTHLRQTNVEIITSQDLSDTDLVHLPPALFRRLTLNVAQNIERVTTERPVSGPPYTLVVMLGKDSQNNLTITLRNTGTQFDPELVKKGYQEGVGSNKEGQHVGMFYVRNRVQKLDGEITLRNDTDESGTQWAVQTITLPINTA